MKENGKPPQTVEDGVHEALEGEMAAGDLRQLAAALERRRQRLISDLGDVTDEEELARLRAQLQDIEAQIIVLLEEASISQFVEETVRFSHQVRRLSEG